jgi:hypothetical protein
MTDNFILLHSVFCSSLLLCVLQWLGVDAMGRLGRVVMT